MITNNAFIKNPFAKCFTSNLWIDLRSPCCLEYDPHHSICFMVLTNRTFDDNLIAQDFVAHKFLGNFSVSERLAAHFQLALSLLNEGPSGLPVKDHNVVADKIKRRLVREKRLEDAARFSGLMNKLLKSVRYNSLMFFFIFNLIRFS